MTQLFRKLYFPIALFVSPILLICPVRVLSIQGISPCWPVIILLPFALELGPLIGLFSGLILAICLDSFTLGGASYIPSLLLLGWWWGCVGKRYRKIRLGLNLGLFAVIGTACVGSSIWVQQYFSYGFYAIQFFHWFNSWAFHTLIAEVIITGLIAPIACSWLQIPLRKKS